MRPIRTILAALFVAIVCASLSAPAGANAKRVVVFSLRSTPELAARAATVTKALAARIQALDGYESVVVAMPKDSPGAAAARAGAEVYVRGQLVSSNDGYRVTISAFSAATDKALGEQTIVLKGTALPSTFDVSALILGTAKSTASTPSSGSAQLPVLLITTEGADTIRSVTTTAEDPPPAPSFLSNLLSGLLSNIAGSVSSTASSQIMKMIPSMPSSFAQGMGDALASSLQSSLNSNAGPPPNDNSLVLQTDTKNHTDFYISPMGVRTDLVLSSGAEFSNVVRSDTGEVVFVVTKSGQSKYFAKIVPTTVRRHLADIIKSRNDSLLRCATETSDGLRRMIVQHNAFHVVGKLVSDGAKCKTDATYDAWVAYIDPVSGSEVPESSANALRVYLLKTQVENKAPFVSKDGRTTTNSTWLTFNAVTSIGKVSDTALSADAMKRGDQVDAMSDITAFIISSASAH